MKPLTRRQEHERKNKATRKKVGVLKGNKPLRDPHYRKFVGGKPCLICYKFVWLNLLLMHRGLAIAWLVAVVPMENDPAHIGPHGIAQKAPDDQCIPLCRRHHEMVGSKKAAVEAMGINVEKIWKLLRAAYKEWKELR